MIELQVTEDAPIVLDVESSPRVRMTIAEQIINQGGAGLSDEVKQTLLAVIQNVAYTTPNGQDYYDALYAALYPPTELDYITAVYTQSGTVYDTDSLDSLKDDLVVTAFYDDGTSEPVTAYTLSGTLTEGTSTITASYGGKTDTFTVTVTADPYANALYHWENLGTSLVDSIGGITATTNATQDSGNNCVAFNASNQYIDFGAIYGYNRSYVITFGTSAAVNKGTHARFWGVDTDSDTAAGGHIFGYRNGSGFAFYTGSWSSTIVSGTTDAVRNMFGDSVLTIYLDSDGKAHAYKDGTLLGASTGTFKTPAENLHVYIGSSAGSDGLYNLQVKSFAVFSGEVTQ